MSLADNFDGIKCDLACLMILWVYTYDADDEILLHGVLLFNNVLRIISSEAQFSQGADINSWEWCEQLNETTQLNLHVYRLWHCMWKGKLTLYVKACRIFSLSFFPNQFFM